ncbi:MAG: efflux system, inner rane transporter CmeB, partial [Myxococcales bacterium]|nr:efflux system, inner rane transporter CmeB [Myxococcales bacterium]
MFVDFFIRRPVLTIVLSLLIVIGGAIAIPTLPIARYPTLASPQVVVSSQFIGASSEAVEASVTTPLETAINGAEGMRYIQSSSTNDGLSTVTVTFDPDRSQDLAAVDVQNRVQSALPRLPLAVRNTGVTVTKSSTSIVVAMAFYAEHGEYSTEYISNYIDRYVRDALLRVSGVGEVRIFNPRTYAMRLWLDPAKLASRNLTAGDVVRAVSEQNLEIAAGQLGREPAVPGQALQFSVRAPGRLSDPAAFERLILSTGDNGTQVLLGDVGRIELGAEDYGTLLRYDGREAIGVGVFQLPAANALDIETQTRAALERLAVDFPPGLRYEIAFNPAEAVRESISEAVKTLAEAIVIVIIVIFLFLQSWRSTIIPAITIPVSLIGTFMFVKMFGFSINTLTLFGITLATGLVVDDAIVVIENIERHLQESKIDARGAASLAMREVAGAVIATSLVLVAVFVPVSFFPGTTGAIYRQFALTIAVSIALSAFNALTLSPALAARLLRRSEKPKRAVFRSMNRAIEWSHRKYRGVLGGILRHRALLVAVFLLSLLLTVCTFRRSPTGFVPDEDQGYIIIIVQGPSGASLQETIKVTKQVETILAREPAVGHVFNVNGFSFLGAGSNRAIMFAALKPFSDRPGEQNTANALVARLRGPFMGIGGAVVIPFMPPAIQGIGTFGGIQVEIEDRRGGPIENLAAATMAVIGAANRDPRLQGLISAFTVDDPQVVVTIDRERAKEVGVSITDIGQALGVYLGSSYINDFTFNERSYRVYAQGDRSFRKEPRDIRGLYVRSEANEMIPLDQLVRIESTTSPQVITRFNLFRAAEINGAAAPGTSPGDAMKVVTEISDRVLPEGMAIEWAGLSYEQEKSGGQTLLIFMLAILIVYLVLSAQYESFALPFIIMLSVPIALLGALLALMLRGLVIDVYAQVGMVMLVGLASKNAILIVEFAEQLRRRGLSLVDAVIEAAEIRLRPILMTSFAFILGMLPLVFASGAGAQSRHAIGTTVVGGMVLSTFLNLLFIPVLYVV